MYSVTLKGINSPHSPNLTSLKDFEIVQRSHNTQYQNINGNWSYSTTYVFYLTPRRTGRLTIPSITYEYDGRDFKTKGFRVEVVKGSVTPKQPRRRGIPSVFDDMDDDFFPSRRNAQPRQVEIEVRPEISKRRAFKGQQLIYKIMLYTRTQASIGMVSSQSIPGFWQEWYPVPKNFSPELGTKTLNGKSYQVFEIRKVALFPNKTGDITIPSLKFQFDVPSGRGFFSRRRSVYRSTPEVTVNVSDLPPAAQGLPVGQFAINVSASTGKVDVNDILTLKIKVSGSGNIKTVNAPSYQSNEYYKIFPAKISRRFNHEKQGVSGIVEAEVPVSFKKEGVISFPSLEFKYFDPRRGPGSRLVTAASQPFTVNVTGQKEVREQAVTIPSTEIVKTGEDIGFIKTGGIHHQEDYFYARDLFWLVLALPFLFNLLFILKVFVFDRFIFQSSTLKQRKLLNRTIKELQQAKEYGDISPILENYLKEKAGVGLSSINSESIYQLFSAQGVHENDSRTFIQIKTKSESSRFSQAMPMTALQKKQDTKTLTDILKRIDSRIRSK